MIPVQLRGASLPASLMDLPDPVAKLHLWGRLPPRPRIAVVGTRCPSESARAFTYQLVTLLSEAGVSVISGGARGIDTAAHEACLTGSAPTLVVGPSGMSQPYPKENQALFQQVVAQGGGYLSAHDDDVVVRRHHFFRRNALLVALSEATVVVQAPLRSGARNAAGWARRLARALFVVPQAPWQPKGLGNLAELELGARLLREPSQVLEFLASRNAHLLGRSNRAGQTLDLPGLGDAPEEGHGKASLMADAVLAGDGTGLEATASLIGTSPRTLDELLALTGALRGELMEQLTQLELQGIIERDPSGLTYRRQS